MGKFQMHGEKGNSFGLLCDSWSHFRSSYLPPFLSPPLLLPPNNYVDKRHKNGLCFDYHFRSIPFVCIASFLKQLIKVKSPNSTFSPNTDKDTDTDWNTETQIKRHKYYRCCATLGVLCNNAMGYILDCLQTLRFLKSFPY